MAIKSLNPYLNFNGNALEAIQLYERALGAKVEHVMRFGEAQGMPVKPGSEQRIMHAHLTVGGGVLMISDCHPDMTIPNTSNASVTLHFETPEEMDTSFDALAAGGKVVMPLAPSFWAARFGMLVDRYGISWLFNCDLPR